MKRLKIYIFITFSYAILLSNQVSAALIPCDANWHFSRGFRINMAWVGEENSAGCFKFASRDEFAWIEMMNEVPYRGWIAGYAKKNGEGYTAWISAIPVPNSLLQGSFVANPNYFVVPEYGIRDIGGRPSMMHMAQLKGFVSFWSSAPVFHPDLDISIEPATLGQISECGQGMASFNAYTEVGLQSRCAILDQQGDILMWYGYGVRGGRRDLHVGMRRSEIIGHSYGLTHLAPYGSYHAEQVDFGQLHFQKTAQGFVVTGLRQETWVRR